MKEINLPDKTSRHRHFGSVDPIVGTKPTEKEKMHDLQNTDNDFYFSIEHVGIKNITYPVIITSSMEPKEQHSIGNFMLTTSLVRNQKGINMSRLPEVLHTFYQNGLQLDFSSLADVSKLLAERMNQSSSTIEVSFPWFFERRSPSMNLAGLMKADVTLETTYKEGIGWKEKISMSAAVTTLCPCSKEISEYSAHNQRGIVTVQVELSQDGSSPSNIKEILLDVMESNASAKLHPILKRPDEKKVTEQAYENPRFVEDLIRLIAADLYLLDWVKAFTIECRNEESIHQHDAYAKMSYRK
ncbi:MULTISPECIES: GTP cyclohydrolase FolE2 [Bacillus]|uniref:GTP cyclohydrolase FolE2 n=1 Tax=Bacillus TaxID=1386 RepID=UPI000BB709CC|nr:MULTISPECIES: GTP cyclohydrolase FolE2 [Bacillus]